MPTRPDPDWILDEVLRIEGGYADIEGDAGGETYYGVSQLAKDEYLALGLPWPPTKDGARDFYTHWWNKSGWAELPISDRLASQMMLLRVHSGQPGLVAQVLQVALCRAQQPVAIDGAIGPQTQLALLYAGQDEVYEQFVSIASGWYVSRKAFAKFGPQWLSHRLRITVKR